MALEDRLDRLEEKVAEAAELVDLQSEFREIADTLRSIDARLERREGSGKSEYDTVLAEVEEIIGPDLFHRFDEAIGARLAEEQDRGAAMLAERFRDLIGGRLGGADGLDIHVHNRATVARDGFSVTVDEYESENDLDEILRACKDAVGALGWSDDTVARMWLEVHRAWMS